MRPFGLRSELTESNAISELLFDVTFAVSLQPLQLIWPLSGWPSSRTVFEFAALFCSRFFLSLHMAVYSNRFKNEEFCDNITKAVMMLGFVMIATSSVRCDGSVCRSILQTNEDSGAVTDASFQVLCIATALCHLVLAGMYSRGCCKPKTASFCRVYSISNLILAVIWLGTSLVQEDTPRLFMLAVVIVVLLLTEIVVRAPALYLRTSQAAHLSTRMRKFQVVSITQVFAGLAQPRLDYSVSLFLFAAGAVSQVLATKVLFFDFEGIHRSDKGFVEPQWVTESVWVAMHMLLAASVTIFGSACSLTVRVVSGLMELEGPAATEAAKAQKPGMEEALRASMWMFCASSAMLIACLTVLSLVLKGSGSQKRRLRKRYRMAIRCAAAGLVLIMPIFASEWFLATLTWSWAVFAASGLLVAAEMYGRAHRKDILADLGRRSGSKNGTRAALASVSASPAGAAASSPSYGTQLPSKPRAFPAGAASASPTAQASSPLSGANDEALRLIADLGPMPQHDQGALAFAPEFHEDEPDQDDDQQSGRDRGYSMGSEASVYLFE
jgi:hypothetical protein